MDEQKQRPRTTWMWWLLIAALLVWNVWTILPARTPVVDIAYTTLLSQVRAGNVASVHVSGDEISGVFKQPFTPPAPASASAGAAGNQTQATPSAGATPPANENSSQNQQSYTDFRTTFPQAVGDTTFLPLLEQYGVTVEVSPPSTPWFAILLTDGLPLLLLLLALAWMGRQAAQSQSGILGFGRSKAREHPGGRTDVTFGDVAGADEAKNELQEIIDFLRTPEKYHELGARIPRGVLLAGPPGTGKTLLARAVAGEANVPFFNISASEFVEMFVGVGASRVRDLFETAKENAPAIVFIDELDAVGRRRGAGLGAVNDEREQTLNQLLVAMDGFDETHEVIVLAATNRPDVLDPALQRPGRFDRQIVIGLPDRNGREGILKIHTRGLRLRPDVDLGLLARTTTGLSGADLANLCNEAALLAARYNHMQITMADFEEAVDKILLGTARSLLLDDHERRVVAYHEAGHAVVAWFTPEADPVHKVTIIPHGRALGVTEQLPDADHYNYSRSYLLARLAVMLGGRSAEEIAIGDVTTGAENDLVEATRLARRMVTQWGMGDLGLAAFATDEQQPFLGYELAQGRDYGDATADRIDQNVQQLLEERHAAVSRLLTHTRERLDQLVKVLLQEETVDQPTLVRILGPRPEAADQVYLEEPAYS